MSDAEPAPQPRAIRIGGTSTIDVYAERFGDDRDVMTYASPRRYITPEGDLFRELVLAVAPSSMHMKPAQVVEWCQLLAAHADLTLDTLSVAVPSQTVLKRKLKRKQETNNA